MTIEDYFKNRKIKQTKLTHLDIEDDCEEDIKLMKTIRHDYKEADLPKIGPYDPKQLSETLHSAISSSPIQLTDEDQAKVILEASQHYYDYHRRLASINKGEKQTYELSHDVFDEDIDKERDK